MQETVPLPVVKSITVGCPPDEAFRFFTAAFGAWWPRATHSCIAFASGHTDQPVAVTFDARPGGLIVEHGRGGERHVWGTVVACDPPSRVAFTWHPGRAADTAQQVAVTFTPDAAGTSVVLAHSGWERLGEKATAVRASYDQGWVSVFDAFAGFVSSEIRST